MVRMWTPLLLLVALLIAACASTPQASHERDADAKQFATHPNAGTIYVYRSPFDSREDEDATLFIDGRIIGQTLPGGYFRIDSAPGRHVLHGTGPDLGQVALETRPGELYFVELTVKGRHSQFRLVPEATGRRQVARCCALMENWAPGQRPLLR